MVAKLCTIERQSCQEPETIIFTLRERGKNCGNYIKFCCVLNAAMKNVQNRNKNFFQKHFQSNKIFSKSTNQKKKQYILSNSGMIHWQESHLVRSSSLLSQ